MLELGIGADIVRGIGTALLAAFGLAILAAVALPKTGKAKAGWTLLVAALFIGPAIPGMYRTVDNKLRLSKATKLFDERCKTAGERIYKTVEGVKGFHLEKLRPEHKNFSDQYALTDPYGSDYGGEAYAASMLWGRGANFDLTNTSQVGAAYTYVTFFDDKSKELMQMRLTGAAKRNGALEFVVAPAADRPQHSVTYEDVSTVEDRKHWIAGSRLRVVDIRNNEILGERVGWMLDTGQGESEGGRSPWLFAAYMACPAFPKVHGRYPNQHGQTRNFVEKVLIPSGEKK